MNRGEFLPEDAPALAAVNGANVRRDALDRAVAAAVTRPISAEDVLAETALGGEDPLAPSVDAVTAARLQHIVTYRAGKEGVLGFPAGRVLSETDGKADPKVVARLLRERLRDADG